MKRFGSLIFVLFLFCLLPVPANAQQLAKIRSEYIDNPIRQYQPADPWHRSILYKLQTGHYGRYYNCDGEEEKRNSPYICWKNSDCPTIPKKRCIDCVNEQICKIKRRINDGSCRESSCRSCETGTCNCGQTGYVAKAQNREVQVARQGNIFEPDVAKSNLPRACNCKACQAKLNSIAAANRVKPNSQVTLPSPIHGVANSIANNAPPSTVEQASAEQGSKVQTANLLSRIKNSQAVRTAESSRQSVAPWSAKIESKRR